MAGFSLIEFFKLGGMFMWPLLLFSITGLAFILERSWVFFKTELNPIAEIASVFEKLKSKNLEDAKKILQDNKKNYIVDVLKQGLDMINQDIPRIEKSMQAEATIKVRILEKRLNGLMVLSNLSPLTGFLGTVSGMINAFKAISVAEEVSTQLVASGIYEALITTVVGLVIAIVMISAYYVFVHKIDNFVSDTERLSNKLIEILIESGVK